MILLFFFKNKFQKYLPGSGQFKFEFSKDFSRFILLHARWTESIHSKYLKLKQTKKKITQKAAIKQNVCIKVGTFVLAWQVAQRKKRKERFLFYSIIVLDSRVNCNQEVNQKVLNTPQHTIIYQKQYATLRNSPWAQGESTV